MAVLATLALVGCATGPTATLPVAVSCIKGEPPAVPVTASEAEIQAMDDYAATLTTYTERLLLKAYSVKADAVIRACK